MPNTAVATTSKPASVRRTAATKPAASKSVATKTATTNAVDAIALLKEDHKKAKKLFKDFEKLKEKGSDEEKAALVSQICMELTVHTRIEEEIFYPAFRKTKDAEDMVDEATVEHASAKDLIRQLQSMQPSDDLYDAKVTVLGEYIEHHVEEEEKEMFKKAKRAKLDMVALGKKLASRKKAIMKELQH
ncbi:hemerythrin HHE cation binding domain-containing protein [Paucimonas lemoignei]|uniref:Hemerythrin HHE cation binding domain-containing protein n=1 Tax=Paucimonas lemoignei TaxID=29443 RepID=A0A4V2UII6_PAULE|nr:hemerythrin domain-containing protein [Paucimonas lemoignei]TCS36310.1 hemerythrin HHE cation binding domain-containing protein [Paucimonas lemoignei]